jgi:hypothetical protein
MTSLIMLGLIPGTDIQITFEAWLITMLLISTFAAAILTRKHWTSLIQAVYRSIHQTAQNLRTTVRPA